MGGSEDIKIDYGNWVSTRMVFFSLGLCLLFGLLFAAAYAGNWIFLSAPLSVLSLFFLLCFLYFIYARHVFAYNGGGIQDKILELLLTYISWDGNGKALDIGCGSGALSIKIAKRFENAHVTGIDYWGGIWEYSKRRCEDNAEVEGVNGRTTFLQASASSLPFPDGAFDLVVSNLVFHEVKDAKDKPAVIKEALRVVKPGGVFVFQDLFLLKRYYGDTETLLETIRGWGIREAGFVDTSKSMFIPAALKLPFMVGTIAVIYGVK